MSLTCLPAPPTPIWLPQKQPAETLDWSIDIAQAISVPTDQIASVAVAAAPSGAGEIALTEIVALGDILTVTLAGGIAGRIYTLQFIVSMTDQRVFQFLAYIAVGQVLAGYPIPPAPSPAFGPQITWTSGLATQGAGLIGVAFVTGAGTNQATATPLTAATSIINGSAAGTGVFLQPSWSILYGQMTVINITVYDQVLYPAGLDSIGAGAPGVGLTVPALTGYVTVNLALGSTVWVVS